MWRVQKLMHTPKNVCKISPVLFFLLSYVIVTNQTFSCIHWLIISTKFDACGRSFCKSSPDFYWQINCSLLPQQQTKVNRLASWSGGSGAGMQSWYQLLCGCIALYSIIEFHNLYIIVIELYCDAHNRQFLSSVHMLSSPETTYLFSPERSNSWSVEKITTEVRALVCSLINILAKNQPSQNTV